MILIYDTSQESKRRQKCEVKTQLQNVRNELLMFTHRPCHKDHRMDHVTWTIRLWK